MGEGVHGRGGDGCSPSHNPKQRASLQRERETETEGEALRRLAWCHEGTLACTSEDLSLSPISPINKSGGWVSHLALFGLQAPLCSVRISAWVRGSQSWLLLPEEH